MATSARNSLAPGRRLIFSPDWGALSVVFDARSGDFWVVDQAAFAALRQISTDPAAGGVDGETADAEVIASLLQHGIIETSPTT